MLKREKTVIQKNFLQSESFYISLLYTNNIEGKITECWLVNEESIFS